MRRGETVHRANTPWVGHPGNAEALLKPAHADGVLAAIGPKG
jgi:hypothetical protein